MRHFPGTEISRPCLLLILNKVAFKSLCLLQVMPLFDISRYLLHSESQSCLFRRALSISSISPSSSLPYLRRAKSLSFSTLIASKGAQSTPVSLFHSIPASSLPVLKESSFRFIPDAYRAMAIPRCSCTKTIYALHPTPSMDSTMTATGTAVPVSLLSCSSAEVSRMGIRMLHLRLR